MANLSALLVVLAAAILSASAAPTTAPVNDQQLRDAGKILSPGLTKFDYSMFKNDMTPAQARALASIMSREAPDDKKREWLMGALASTPSRPTVSGAQLESFKDLAQFAAVAYCANSNTVSSWSCGKTCSNSRVSGVTPVAALQAADTFGYVAVRPKAKQIIISFRGSVNSANWIDNLQVSKVDYPWPRPAGVNTVGVSVHKGFTDVYKVVRDKLLSTLKSTAAANPDFEVVFTGHSLGGAVATLAATDAVGTGTVPARRIRIINFGAPRVGNKEFGTMLGNLGFAGIDRLVNENDIVPHIPPQFSGYWHSAGEKYIYNGQVYVCNGLEDDACSNSRVPFVSSGAHGGFLGQEKVFGTGAC
ncbi:hypothetical protein H9P43_004642 [Blastocladiella emersonii ATCC 22665]|nr:hypothetical protein H9P43_004642 [Blastocladiella emersonii ATCC 22665]